MLKRRLQPTYNTRNETQRDDRVSAKESSLLVIDEEDEESEKAQTSQIDRASSKRSKKRQKQEIKRSESDSAVASTALRFSIEEPQGKDAKSTKKEAQYTETTRPIASPYAKYSLLTTPARKTSQTLFQTPFTFVSPPRQLTLLQQIGGGSSVQPTPIARFFQTKPEETTKNHSTSLNPAVPSVTTNTPLVSSLSSSSSSSSDVRSIASEPTDFLPRDQQQRKKVRLICLQHALDTTASLLQAFVDRGIDPSHIYFLDKMYSTNKTSLKKICGTIGNKNQSYRENPNVIKLATPDYPWEYGANLDKHIKKLDAKVLADMAEDPEAKDCEILLLDDGGKLISMLPKELAANHYCYGVEQTTRGHKILLENPPKCPWISVADSNIKRNEDEFIGELAERRVKEVLQSLVASTTRPQDITCGIVGFGHIGQAVAKALVAAGYKVCFYDAQDKQAPTGTEKCTSPDALIKKSDFVIGCTGEDSLKGIDLPACITKNTQFISCSSEAIEWEYLMKTYVAKAQNLSAYKDDPTTNLVYKINGHDVTFVYGGHPATFDVTKQHAVAPEKIAITRAALFNAIMQWLYHKPSEADKTAQKCEKPTPLNAALQKHTTAEWRETLEAATKHEQEAPTTFFSALSSCIIS